MNAAFFAYSRQGMETARRSARCLKTEDLSIRLFAPEKYCTQADASEFLPIPRPGSEVYEEQFHWAQLMVFVSAMGICIRSIAPYVKDKKKDPAVVCVDEKGKFVISVLSGHIGGANRWTAQLAEGIHALPVITTATDVNHRFSVDSWAAEHGFAISSMDAARDISAAILEQDVCLKSDFPLDTYLPSGVINAGTGPLGIYISWKIHEPFQKTLRLIPPVLHLGIGCRKDTPEEDIRQAVHSVLEEYQIDKRAVKGIYSIDLKAKEKGLLEFCREEGWTLCCYTAEELQEVEGMVSSSAFVKSITGVDNVCERAALRDAGTLLVPKTVRNHVTVAVAQEDLRIRFDQAK